MRSSLYTIIVLLITSSSFGQRITIQGSLMDSDGYPVSGVRCYINEEFKTNSNSLGMFDLIHEIGSLDTLKFQHVGFDDLYVAIDDKMERNVKKGILKLELIMPDKVTEIIEVRANDLDTIHGTQAYSVSDFEFGENGEMVLLTYEKNIGKGSILRLIDRNGETRDSYLINEVAISLKTDFKGNIHLITKKDVFLVLVANGQMHLYPENSYYFYNNLAPVVDSIGDYIYYTDYSEIYTAFNYIEYNRVDSVLKQIGNVEDKVMMDIYRSEYEFIDRRQRVYAMNKALETGIDKKIVAGATFFTRSILYEPIYAPMFKVGKDSIFMFDHYKNFIYKYIPGSGVIDSVRITYHKNKEKSGWKKRLIQDQVNGKIYGFFEKDTRIYLCEIDCTTGFIKDSFRINYKHIEQIKIRNDFVYYIYRPFESIQKKYLYREKL